MKLPERILLGVNVDHIATIRQARMTRYPDPVQAALAAEEGGADGITVHLREDRRHIQARDVEMLQDIVLTRLNLEMAVTPAMLDFAEKISPAHCCLVPEKREELTTEGGLNVLSNEDFIREACQRLGDRGIDVSLFIDPELEQIDAAIRCGAPTIEIHTGQYADAANAREQQQELLRVQRAASYAHQAGLIVNAGHGLHYQNVHAIAALPEIKELNIGHALVARAFMIGMTAATREMKQLMLTARNSL